MPPLRSARSSPRRAKTTTAQFSLLLCSAPLERTRAPDGTNGASKPIPPRGLAAVPDRFSTRSQFGRDATRLQLRLPHKLAEAAALSMELETRRFPLGFPRLCKSQQLHRHHASSQRHSVAASQHRSIVARGRDYRMQRGRRRVSRMSNGCANLTSLRFHSSPPCPST